MIWENVNESRATHIFISSIESHETVLTKVESFVCTSMKYKRSLLYFENEESEIIRRELGYLSTLRHGDFEDYKNKIQQLIEN